MDRQLEMRIALLASRRKSIQNNIDRQQDSVDKVQSSMDALNKQLQKIDNDILQLKSRDEKQSEQDSQQNNVVVDEDADGAISTGALDASSSGGSSGYASWRYYPKIGDTTIRYKSGSKKKKKKVYENFIESVWVE